MVIDKKLFVKCLGSGLARNEVNPNAFCGLGAKQFRLAPFGALDLLRVNSLGNDKK